MAIVARDSDSVRTSTVDWKAIVKSAIRDPGQLVRRLGLPSQMARDSQAADEAFQTFVPEPYLERIRPGDPDDPLLLQVLPQKQEALITQGFSADAVGDSQAERSAGLIHKYQGRVLLITSGACAVHCRYCFRRHFPYSTAPVSIQQFDQTLDTVRNDSSIEEVILSGGDPLMLVDKKLQQLLQLIEAIPHVRRLRIHTRLPVVIPARVTNALLHMLQASRLAGYVVVHINHANEIDQHVQNAMQELNRAGVTLLNQAVLLKGVNDNVEALVALSKTLVDLNCIPYYLHQLDRVQGAAHFEVDESKGKSLVEQMRARLPGFAVPNYVREIAGEASKTVL